jgi:hypothetical protein
MILSRNINLLYDTFGQILAYWLKVNLLTILHNVDKDFIRLEHQLGQTKLNKEITLAFEIFSNLANL